ncbi:hypothetical protein OH491_24210 [Termitidicoccus mucosus]|uniref:Uncharacterized protein n=1 Tax=Termitidicoccus mucosus TaxID=1184151 RepID=A0A178IPL2_9BACT|nr:hypothetical protein AW736_02245 [Opitutaceae bacterium TSB47]
MTTESTGAQIPASGRKPPPAGQPESTAHYNPQGTASPTHDIRVEKHEDSSRELLKPFAAEKSPRSVITIAAEEYQRLKKLDNLKLLGLHPEKTRLPKAEETRLRKLVTDSSIDAIAGEKKQELEKASRVQTEIAVKKALEAAQKRSRKKTETKGLRHRLLAVGLILAAGLAGWQFKPREQNRIAQSPSTIEIAPERQAQALNWAFHHTDRAILWITSVADRDIIRHLQAKLQNHGNLGCVILVTQEAAQDFETIAREINVTTYVYPGSLGHINRLIFDDQLILDATSATGVILMPNPAKAREIKEWITAFLEPHVYQLHRSD